MFQKNNIMKKLNKNYTNKIEILEKVNEVIDGRQEEILLPFLVCWANPKEFRAKENKSTNVNLEEIFDFEVMYCSKLEEMRALNENGNKRRFIVKFKDFRYEVNYIDYLNESKTNVLIKAKRIN